MKKFLMVLAGLAGLYVLSGLTMLFLMKNSRLDIRPGGAAVACRSNCKNIATAIAMYADDFRLPPSDLGRLTAGNYLKIIPTCPMARQDSYSSTYVVEGAQWTLYCRGEHHKGEHPDESGPIRVDANFPLASSRAGVVMTQAELDQALKK